MPLPPPKTRLQSLQLLRAANPEVVFHQVFSDRTPAPRPRPFLSISRQVFFVTVSTTHKQILHFTKDVNMSENTAVENVAATLEKTKLDAPVTNEAQVAHATSAAEGRRLYIGNLAYSTTEEQLTEFFTEFPV